MSSNLQIRLPRHIAVIMDGNNRWARGKGLSGVAGHRAGAEAARSLVDGCIERHIEHLTLFAFSSENWLRPQKEVRGLMALFLAVLKRKEIEQFHERNVKVKFVGNRSSFSNKLQVHMRQVENLTQDNSGLNVNVAVDYGGRQDIIIAAKAMYADVNSGELDLADMDEKTFQRYVALGDIPEPDLCIRTGGERRISNFLLWQFAYTELYFTECYWPDFDDTELQAALDDFSQRQRRFGQHPLGAEQV